MSRVVGGIKDNGESTYIIAVSGDRFDIWLYRRDSCGDVRLYGDMPLSCALQHNNIPNVSHLRPPQAA